MKFRYLFNIITINGLVLKNRLVMPALHHTYTPGGYANDRFNQYYWRRAEGGAALIFVGGCMIDNYQGYGDIMSLQSDEFIPGYKTFTDGMHARGTKVGVQLMHTGRYGKSKYIIGDDVAIAPSAVYSNYTRETPRAMTIDEIKEVINNFAEAAARAKKAGFDIVELCGSAGYLISQFLSPVTNLREDEYGGSFEKRCRFALEIVAAVREAVGKDYPLCVRVAGKDFIQGGNKTSDCVAFCKMLEEAGVDMISVTGGWHETTVPQLPGEVPKGAFAYLAQAVKDAVFVPVMSSNRYNDPVVAEQVLALEQADLIGVGRTLIADPDWPNKAMENRLDEIRRCVACNQGCLGRMFFDQPIECLVNGYAGREYLFTDKEMINPQKLLVVGAGPAGCEFAIRAAERGHQVTLWEKEDIIGGQLPMVVAPPSKREFGNLARYFETMLYKKGVDVVLGKTATALEIQNADFDAIILATGIIPSHIPLPEDGSIPIYSALDILAGKMVAGRDVVMVGGGAIGCETAQYLAHNGSISEEQLYFMMSQQSEEIETITAMLNSSRRHVSIIDIVKIGSGFDPGCGWPVMKDLKRMGVKQYSFAKINIIKEGKIYITVTDKKTKEVSEVEIPCDTIIMAVGSKPNNALYEELKNSSIPIYNIGDSTKAGKVLDAIRQADDLAMKF